MQQSNQASSAASKSFYTAAGLTGAGQILAVADTGVDVQSCFFSDPSKGGAVAMSTVQAPVFDLSYR
jgi:hypothetical protein